MYALRLPKSLLANFSSHEISGMRPSTSEDEERSTTGAFLEGPPGSNTGERGWRDETSDGDPNSGGDSKGADGGVGALLDDGLPSLEGERAYLVLLLSSNAHKWGTRKVNIK
jgi:hypothetical protein